ncbi:MAG: glutamate-5-semialdehyde dehydrogenase [bacterium]|nr:glutamate-5-semialdehyde dehydrogenase [bacterium]
MSSIKIQCKKAHLATRDMARLSTKVKNTALKDMAKNISSNIDNIIKANEKDIHFGVSNNLSKALIDRLTLNKKRLDLISESLITIAQLKDPTGEIIQGWTMANRLQISKVRVPIGTIGIIYEARPNVTADAIGLSIKTGNSVVLRGSSSAYNSNLAITDILKKSAAQNGINPEAIQLLEDTSREGVSTFVKSKEYIDLIIPRGGSSLIQTVVNTATVPTIETGVGICHTYVDSAANLSQALDIIINAKVQRPSVCNSCETLLVHKDIAKDFLPQAVSALKKLGVEIKGCKKTKMIVPDISTTTKNDWATEYLDLILNIKTVETIEDAVNHIYTFGTNHSEAIISDNIHAINKFSKEVDAAAIVVNASTRFVDGGEFGFGAEMGISTQKLHARGPLGLNELTSYKYIVQGEGHVRQ